MPQVLMVSTWRPTPGQFTALIEAANQAKKVHQRLGADVQIWQTQIGGEPETIVYGTRFENGKAYGEFIDKLEADKEWQGLMATWTSATTPIATLIRNATLSQIG
jgi:hypothetical protein